MALRVFDRVKETTTTTGTGTITLAGAMTGFRTFSSVLASGDTVYYALQSVDASGMPTGAWEVGLGTYTTSGNTLARTTLLASSTGTSISLAGTTQVWLDLPAFAVLQLNSAGRLMVGATDNGVDKLQVAGTISATAPAQYDNSSKVPTTQWTLANAMPLNAPLGGGVDLNTVTASGVYHQPANANTTSTGAANYPVSLAGMLEVYSSSVMTYQRYTVYNTGIMYTRALYQTTWAPWRQQLDLSQGNTYTSGNIALQAAGGLSPYLYFIAGSYQPFVRANASNSSIEVINSANNAVNLSIADGGTASVRGNLNIGGNGFAPGYYVTYSGIQRWAMAVDGSGNLFFGRYNTSGTWVASPLQIALSDGTLTTASAVTSYYPSGNYSGAFRVSADYGSSWTGWNGSSNAALQVDCPTYGAAYFGVRFTRWGGRHLGAIAGYEPNTTASPQIAFLVGTDSSPGFWFGQAGIGTYNTSWTITSDYRLKKDVETLDAAAVLARVRRLRPVEFARTDAALDGRRFPGYIAHETQAEFPLLVTGEKDAMRPKIHPADFVGPVSPDDVEIDPQTVDLPGMSAYHTAAIQALADQLDAALARIAKLEAA